MFTLFSSRFSKLALGLVVLFTVVEIVTLVVWLILALRGEQILAVVVLAGGLTVEHFISAATGTHISTNEQKPGSN